MRLGEGMMNNSFDRQQKTLDREAALRQREEDLRRRELQLANKLNALTDSGSTKVNNELHHLAGRIVEKAFHTNPLKPVTIRAYVNKSPVTWNGSKVRRGVQSYSESARKLSGTGLTYSEAEQDPSCVTPTGKLRSGIKRIKPFARMKATDAEPKTPVAECFDINPRATDILKRKLEKQRTRNAIQEVAGRMKDEYGRVSNDEPSAKSIVRSPLTDYSKTYDNRFSSESDRGVNIDLNMPAPNVPGPRFKIDTRQVMNDTADSVGKETLTRNGKTQVPGQSQWDVNLKSPRKPKQGFASINGAV